MNRDYAPAHEKTFAGSSLLLAAMRNILTS